MEIQQLEMELCVEKRRRELRRRVPMGEAQWWFDQMRHAVNLASDMANKNATDRIEKLVPGQFCAVGR
jgi:hypothetical protein